FLADFSDGVRLAALPLLAAQLARSPAAVAAVTAVQSLPWLIGPGLGVIVDRNDRRRLTVAVDTAPAAIIRTLARAIVRHARRRAGADLPHGLHHRGWLGPAQHCRGHLRAPAGAFRRPGPGEWPAHRRADRRQRASRTSGWRLAVRPGGSLAVRRERRGTRYRRAAAAHPAQCLPASRPAGPA